MVHRCLQAALSVSYVPVHKKYAVLACLQKRGWADKAHITL